MPPETAEGSLLQRVEPEYPEEARQQRIQGAVVLDVRIGRDGAIEDVKLVSGQPLLANAAIAAVKQWRFKPRTQKGQPVEMQTRVTLNFRMPSWIFQPTRGSLVVPVRHLDKRFRAGAVVSRHA